MSKAIEMDDKAHAPPSGFSQVPPLSPTAPSTASEIPGGNRPSPAPPQIFR